MKISDQALIFDIKRFAVHDGEGLRTTVFFKGCQLRCQWCQNPEGLEKKRQPIYLENHCIHCRICEKEALEGQLVYKNDRPYFNRNYEGSFDHVIDSCPSTAIRYDSSYYDTDTLYEEVMKDEVFYMYGGGVTFSGGEPLLHSNFILKLLKKLKEAGIHTAIETSFYASWSLIEPLLPYLDRIYVDCKLIDRDKHLAYTEVDNTLIKENIEKLLTSIHKDKVIIRTPLIPTRNCDNETLIQISRFLTSIYPDVAYELLNYNPLAPDKYSLVDLTYTLDDYKPFTAEEMDHFRNVVKNAGIKNLIIE